MTEVLDHDIREVVETIWSVTLGLDLLGPAGSIPPPPEETICGCIYLTGAWSGLVTISMSERLARRAAASMFDAAPEGLSTDELHDALGELANMTGGSIKALLPGPSQLSLPSVISGERYSVSTPRGNVINDVAFRCGVSQIRVRVIEAREQVSPAA